jgi:hypothetical protein
MALAVGLATVCCSSMDKGAEETVSMNLAVRFLWLASDGEPWGGPSRKCVA